MRRTDPLPRLLIFIISGSILLLELAVARMSAKHIGVSLETWTAVIGVLLSGIAVGNVMGGRLADRKRPDALMAPLMLLAAASAAAILPLDLAMPHLASLPLPWLARVLLVIFALLFPPSMILGLISPVVTRIALAPGKGVGGIMGSMYMWSSLGSIAGTYLTGFVLFTFFRLQHIVLFVAALLFLMGFLTHLVHRNRR